MSEKSKKDQKGRSFFERNIDPSVAARVDEIMSEGPEETKPAPPPAEANALKTADEPSSGAPLLPSDKLPKAVTEQNPSKKTSVKSKPEILSKQIYPEAKLESDGPIGEDRFDHDNVGLDDPATEKAVDEIVREEADKILEAEDAKAKGAAKHGKKTTPKSSKILVLSFLFIAVLAAAGLYFWRSELMLK